MSENPLTKARRSIGALKTFVANQLARGDTTGKGSSRKNCNRLLAQASIIEKLIRCINKLDQLRIDIKIADDSELEETSDRPLQPSRAEIEYNAFQLLSEWQALDWELRNAMTDDPGLHSLDKRDTVVRPKLFSWRIPKSKSPERNKTPAFSLIVGEFIDIR